MIKYKWSNKEWYDKYVIKAKNLWFKPCCRVTYYNRTILQKQTDTELLNTVFKQGGARNFKRGYKKKKYY